VVVDVAEVLLSLRVDLGGVAPGEDADGLASGPHLLAEGEQFAPDAVDTFERRPVRGLQDVFLDGLDLVFDPVQQVEVVVDDDVGIR